MADRHYDLIVIGAGAAGSGAASTAAKKGHHVLQIERGNIGGTCLNYGCDPTKTLLQIANFLHQARQAERNGLCISTTGFDWPAIQQRVHKVINTMRGGTFEEASRELARSGVEVLHGEAHFVSTHAVEVAGQRIEADRFVIASGSEALIPPIEGLEDCGFITNKEAVWLSSLPRSLVIVGGGAIGIEFAQMFHRFGVRVTLIESAPTILVKEDQELATFLTELLRKEGLELNSQTELRKAWRGPDGKHLLLNHPQEGNTEIVVDEILMAVGRHPSLEALQPEKAGLEISKKGLIVDQNLRANQPHIWGAGDVLGGLQFTHVASEQGRIAGYNAFADTPRPFDDRVVPWVTFTDPPLAHVGQTEEELRTAGSTYRSITIPFDQIERAIIEGRTDGRLKLLLDKDGKLLGCHIAGKNADDLISQIILAMQANLSVKQLAEAMMPYPTLSEAIRAAAQEA